MPLLDNAKKGIYHLAMALSNMGRCLFVLHILQCGPLIPPTIHNCCDLDLILFLIDPEVNKIILDRHFADASAVPRFFLRQRNPIGKCGKG